MLVSRRVVEDGGLRIYQLPVEQAIFSQMGYQVTMSVFHAIGTPDAGNLLSLAFSGTLLLARHHGTGRIPAARTRSPVTSAMWRSGMVTAAAT